MAEIDIERRRKLGWFPWVLATLLLLAVVGTAWYLAGPGGGLGSDADTFETYPPAPAPGTQSPSAPAPPAPSPPAPSPGTPP